MEHSISTNKNPVRNCNCNRPLVAEFFYNALAAFDPNDIKGKTCNIADDYVSVYDSDSENLEGLIYDNRMQRVLSENEWGEHALEYGMEQDREREKTLKKHGLLDAYISLKSYLENHNNIKRINRDANKDCPAPYEIIERDLTYGYELSGFEILEDSIVWVITTYERPIKQNDCIRGEDDCYLMFKDGVIVEAELLERYELMCDINGLPKSNYEKYSSKYINISDILQKKCSL